jgi:hypothetical protein
VGGARVRLEKEEEEEEEEEEERVDQGLPEGGGVWM